MIQNGNLNRQKTWHHFQAPSPNGRRIGRRHVVEEQKRGGEEEEEEEEEIKTLTPIREDTSFV